MVLLSEPRPMIIKLEQSAIKLSPINVLADRSRISGVGQNFYRIPGSLSIVSKTEVLEFSDTDINKVISQVPGVYLQEKSGWIALIRGIGAGTNVLLNFIFIPKYGIIGAAGATCFSFILMSLLLYILNLKIFPIQLKRHE